MPDVRNPLAPTLSDYDFLEFVAFVWKVKGEGSYAYAEEHYGPRFEAPEMQATADDSTQLKAFYRANLKAVDAWWETVGGETAVDLHNAHIDEERKRRENGRLWGIRCTDGHVITCDTRDYRDQLAASMQAEEARPGRRKPAALLQRLFPGSAWHETRLTA